MATKLQQYLQNLAHSKNIPRNGTGRCFITCDGRVDGAGAQAHAIISVMVAAKYLGFTYVHTEMKRIDHNDNDIDRNKWLKQWQEFFNLGCDELSIDQYKTFCPTGKIKNTTFEILDRYPVTSLYKILPPNCIYVVNKAHYIVQKYNNDPDFKKVYHEVLLELQLRYHKTPKPRLRFYLNDYSCLLMGKNQELPSNVAVVDKCIHIAVHIRRGDVARGSYVITKKRFKENVYFYSVISQIEDILQKCGKEYQFHIFSEGTLKDDFPELYWIDKSQHEVNLKIPTKIKLFNKSIRIHLDGDPREALHHLVSANVLVMAKSCYSFIAGMLNPKSIKLYTKFWFKPVYDDWIVISDNNTFDQEQFKLQLLKL
jgi:hypothetical protein